MQELDKEFYKIKDVAEIVGVPQSTLRYWESQFPECKPRRNVHNIRYYKPEDIEIIRIVHFLVKTRGLKIEAAREQLRVNRKNVSKRLEVIDRLTDVRNRLKGLMTALEARK